jgi:hypothetical protein
MRPKLPTLVAGTVLMLALVGCPPTGGGRVLNVAIDGGDRTVRQGTTTTLTASVQTDGGASTAVAWTSSDPSVADIDDDGALEALAAGTSTITAISVADPTKNDAIVVTVDPPGAVRWTRQFGTDALEIAYGIATGVNGGLYAAGFTEGGLEGPSAGTQDAYVRSFDRDGALLWTRQFGTVTSDLAFGVAADADGNATVVGFTFGDLGGPNTGGEDAFVRSYDANGDLRWTRQFGTAVFDTANAVAADASGNLYVAGGTEGGIGGPNAGSLDALLRAYDANGGVRWTRQFGTGLFDVAQSVAVDAAGNAYVAGNTRGALGGANAGNSDAFVIVYDATGGLRWSRQFGTSSEDLTTGVAVDADGTVYVTGYTTGALVGANAGGEDAFVRSYDVDGVLRWTRQFGSSGDDRARGIATDPDGHPYVAGTTAGVLDGSSAGLVDAFVRAFDRDGGVRFTRQFGTDGDDRARSIATDADGNAYTAGDTVGDLDGPNAGSTDAFVRAFAP